MVCVVDDFLMRLIYNWSILGPKRLLYFFSNNIFKNI